MHQKISSLLNFVPFVSTCLTYLHASRASNYYVLTCLGALNYYVAMCLRALIYYVPTWLRVYVSSFFTCLYILACQYKFFTVIYLRALNHFLPTRTHFFTCLPAFNHPFTSAPCIVVFLWIMWPFIPFKTPKQSLLL